MIALSKYWKIILAIFFISGFIYIKFYVAPASAVKMSVEKIHMSFSGTIIDKYSPRNTDPTHMVVKLDTGNITITPTSNLLSESQIGDSIVKVAHENIAYLIDSMGNRKKYFYILLSEKTRQHRDFPDKWRDKWQEATVKPN